MDKMTSSSLGEGQIQGRGTHPFQFNSNENSTLKLNESEAISQALKGFNKSLNIFASEVTKATKNVTETEKAYEETKKLVAEKNKDLDEAKKQVLAQMETAKGDELKKLEDTYSRIEEEKEKNNNKLKKADEDYQKAKFEKDKENQGILAKNLSAMLASGLTAITAGIKSTIDKVMDTQAIMSYNLIGTGKSLAQTSGLLNRAINGMGVVRQEKVYDKLNSLITGGIVYNAEQRAYLAALSEELGMGFQVESAGLTRLVNLQREDLTLNRMAIQDSLKTFLNQNYQTSQYIKEGFQSVAESLLEAQSFMESRSAIQLESTVQKWLGTLSSLGMSQGTITSLATAIGKLGSGNLSSLSGDKMQTLMILGASKTGQDYAEMLTHGVNAQQAEMLMAGIASYLTEVAGRDSNVVKSAFSDLLGISFSDLKAITNLQGNYPTNINLDTTGKQMMMKVDSSIYLSTKLHNILENLKWSTGSDIATSQTKYLLYKGIDMISNLVGGALSGITIKIGGLFGGVDTDLGKIAEMIPEVLLAGMAVPQMISGVFNGIGSLFGGGQAWSILRRLGPTGRNRMVTSAGNFSILSGSSQSGSSGSVIMSDTGETEMLDSAKTSSKDTANKTYDEEDESIDIKTYKLLGGDDARPNTIFSMLSVIAGQLNDFPTKTWEIATNPKLSRISIGSSPGEPGEDVMGATYKCIYGIYTLLMTFLSGSAGLSYNLNPLTSLSVMRSIESDMSGFINNM